MTDPRPGIDREALTGQLMTQLNTVIREMKCVGSQRLLRRGVSMSHLHVMSMLERHGELTMSKVAEALDVSVSNVTGLVDRMEERGLVERARVPDDRRVVQVCLTPAGRAVLSDLEVFRDETLGRVIDRLDERQLARLVRTLEDVRVAVTEVVAEDPDLFAHNHQFHDEPAASPEPSAARSATGP